MDKPGGPRSARICAGLQSRTRDRGRHDGDGDHLAGRVTAGDDDERRGPSAAPSANSKKPIFEGALVQTGAPGQARPSLFRPLSPLGKHEGPPTGSPRNFLFQLGNFGAGEEIRTLDPNLGKVMLYP